MKTSIYIYALAGRRTLATKVASLQEYHDTIGRYGASYQRFECWDLVSGKRWTVLS